MQHWQLHYCEHVTNLYCDHDSMSGSIYLFIEQKAESFIDSPRCQDGEPRLQELEHPEPRPQAQVGAQEVERLHEVEGVQPGPEVSTSMSRTSPRSCYASSLMP